MKKILLFISLLLILINVAYSQCQGPSISPWFTYGNIGTTNASYLGTADNEPLRFGINQNTATTVPTGGGIIDITYKNTALGIGTLSNLWLANPSATGADNTAMGYYALELNTSGTYNVALAHIHYLLILEEMQILQLDIMR